MSIPLFRTHKCRPQASTTESCDLKIKEACVHPGSKAPSFEKWAVNRPSCLKHTCNLTHFPCKCPPGKRYKIWKATIGGGAISAICASSKRVSAISRCFVPRLFSRLFGICARRSMLHGRLEAERHPASAGPPLGGQAAALTSLSLFYGTEPCCPV